MRTVRAPVMPWAIVMARAVLNWPHRGLPPVGISKGDALHITTPRHADVPAAKEPSSEPRSDIIH